jgi:hypothetical protein
MRQGIYTKIPVAPIFERQILIALNVTIYTKEQCVTGKATSTGNNFKP